MDRNLISQRQTDALKLEALRAYFDSRRGRGPAHRREPGRETAKYRCARCATGLPGETFRVLKEKEIRQFGEYRTQRLVLVGRSESRALGP